MQRSFTETAPAKGKLPTRDRIVAAAYRCFDTFGVPKTTMSDIAQAADVSRRTVYNYFPTKEDIITALSAIESAKINAEIRRLIRRHDRFADTLTECVFLAARIAEQSPYSRHFVQSSHLTSISADPRGRIHEEQKARWRSLLSTGFERGDLAGDLDEDQIVSWLTLSWDPLESTCRHASLSIL